MGKRWKMTGVEQALLEETLQQTSRPTREVISSLAVLFGRTEKQVRVWFQNQRQRTPACVSSLPDALVVLAAMHAHAFPECPPEESVAMADTVVSTWPDSAETLARTAITLQVQVEAARLLRSEPQAVAFAVASGAVVQRIARCYQC